MKQSLTKQLGNAGEQLVADFLRNKGFAILAQNYRQRYGEVDLIAEKGDVIAFVEVKARTNPAFSALQSITRSKQHKIFLAAKSFMVTHNVYNKVLRFDVALVTVEACNTSIDYIENAFIPTY